MTKTSWQVLPREAGLHTVIMYHTANILTDIPIREQVTLILCRSIKLTLLNPRTTASHEASLAMSLHM